MGDLRRSELQSDGQIDFRASPDLVVWHELNESVGCACLLHARTVSAMRSWRSTHAPCAALQMTPEALGWDSNPLSNRVLRSSAYGAGGASALGTPQVA